MAQNSNLNSLIQTGLPSDAPPQFKHSEVRAAVELFIQSTNNLLRQVEQYCGITQKDPSLWSSLPPTETLFKQNLGRLYVVTNIALTYGMLVNLFNNGGVLTARKAQAISGTVRKAHGYCNVTAGIPSGSYGEIILGQGIIPVAGVLPAQDLYLSAVTPGAMTTASPFGSGEIAQYVGYGIKTNLAYIDIVSGEYIPFP